MAANKLQLQVILSVLEKATAPLKRIQGGSLGAAKALKETRDRLKDLNTQQKDVSAWRTQRAAAEQTEQALGAARDKVKQLSRDIAASGAPTRQMSRDFKAAVREATALKQAHGNQQTQLQGLRNKLNAAGISTRNLGAGERELRAKIAATNSALQQQENRLKRITNQQKRLAAAKSQYQKTQGLAGSMAGSGAAGLATGSGMLYAGARVMAPGLEFDASMSKVQALTRLDKDSAELQALRDQARQLGASTQFTAGQAADAQGYLGMAGFDPKAIKAAMPGMLDLAKAGGAELAETADIASNILTGLNLKASDMGRVGDILVGTFTRSNTNLQMLGDTMKYVAPVAAGVGQDIETVAAMAGKLGDAGIQGSMGGTALRAIISRLAKPPAMAAKALDKLGISAKDAQGNMRQMPDILTELNEKTKDLGNADRAGFFKSIAGEEAFSALQVLVDNAGSGDLQKFIGTLREAQGEAGKTAKVMADNLAGDLDALNSAWEDLGIQMQDQQNGPMRELTQSLTSVVGGVKSWIAENPELAGQIVKTAAGLGILIAAGGAIALTLASILGPIAMVRYGMALLSIKGGGLLGTLWSLGKTALPLVATGLRILAAAAMANPILAIITGIALGAALIYANWDTVGPYFASLWAEIKAGFSGGLGGIAALIVNFSPAGLFYRAFAAVMNYFGVEMPGKFTEFGSMLINGMVTGITNGLGALKTAITGAGESAIGWFKEKLGIHSPSRVFAELGGFTMAGLANGLAGGEGDVLKQIAGTAKRLASSGADMFSGKGLTLQSPPQTSTTSAPEGSQFKAFTTVAKQLANSGANLLSGKGLSLQPPMPVSAMSGAEGGLFKELTTAAKQLANSGANLLTGKGLSLQPPMPVSTMSGAEGGLFKELTTAAKQLAKSGANLLSGKSLSLQPPMPASAMSGAEGGLFKEFITAAKQLASSGADMLSGKSISFDSRPPISAASGGMVIQGDTNHFQIHATPGTDVAGLQRMINQMLDERERNKATRIRSRLGDLD